MVHLLDVNVLIALTWPVHESHTRVQKWFGNNSAGGWATCPFTQSAMVRIISNPAFSRDAVPPQQAIKVLEANLKHPTHQFWPDDIGLVQAVEPARMRLIGHRQVSDAYLLGLAIHRKSRLATMDRSIMALLPRAQHNAITLL